eukprot:TRINITY_DN8623_c0_g1_i1.p1 TRINITY_DN8623_c0_g1~~TRINITY_DN8623_c0_g1_i1.p1  ORF type:complete len:234 (-),score=42.30 TRINITY_DN8623_c0_g1_i1:148-849(-)
MDLPQFIPFPRTPHLEGSSVVDDDESVSETQFYNLIKIGGISRVVVQEKVDGTNVSIHFEQEWVPVLQKRSGLIGQGERNQYNLFRDYVNANLETFWDILGTRYCIFGEGLWQQHSIKYEELESFFVVFDIWDKKSKKFLSYARVTELVQDRLTTVPLVKIWETQNQTNVKFQSELLGLLPAKSHYGKDVQEGVYVRFESPDFVEHRFKLRRKTFVAGNNDFDRNPQKNKLRS